MRFVHHLILATAFLLIHHHKPAPIKPTQNWAALAECESSGNPQTNTGNGFYGAFQFDLPTWYGLGRIGLPSDYSYRSQKRAAIKLYKQRGSQPWPVCGAYL